METENAAEVTETEQPPAIPTETVESLSAKLVELEAAKNEAVAKASKNEEGYKNIQRTLNEKDRAIKESADLKGDVAYLKDAIKMVLTQGLQVPEEELESPERKQKATQAFTELERQHNAKREADNRKAEEDTRVNEAQAMLQRAVGAGMKQDSDEYVDVYDHLVEGKPYKAERIIKKFEASNKEKPVEESVEDLKKKWIEEGKRQAFEESGGLKTSTSHPTGTGTLTWEQVKKMSPAEYKEHQAEIDEQFPLGMGK